MTEQEKQLLLTDLCAMLTTGLYLLNVHTQKTIKLESIDTNGFINYDLGNPLHHFKPFLRPLSSMTDEEREEYRKFSYYGAAGVRPYPHYDFVAVPSFEKMDWLHAHHFDYRGLIPKGLALEAPEGMYK